MEKSRSQAWHWKIYSCHAVLEGRILLGIGEFGCTIPHPGVLRGASRECSRCLCLEELGFCLVCVKALKVSYKASPLPHIHSKVTQCRPLTFHHWLARTTYLQVIDGPGGLAFLHPVLILFRTLCSQTDLSCLG